MGLRHGSGPKRGVLGTGQARKRGVLCTGQVKKGGSLLQHISVQAIYVSAPPPPPRLRLRETPYTTPSDLPSTISAHTASLLPCKGRYPQLHGRGYDSFPGTSEVISISHLGVSRGHRNIPQPSHCVPEPAPDSSGLRRPPSRTLRLSHKSHNRRPIQLSTHSKLPTGICTPQFVRLEQQTL